MGKYASNGICINCDSNKCKGCTDTPTKCTHCQDSS